VTAHAGEDIGDGLAGVALVDPVPLRRKGLAGGLTPPAFVAVVPIASRSCPGLPRGEHQYFECYNGQTEMAMRVREARARLLMSMRDTRIS